MLCKLRMAPVVTAAASDKHSVQLHVNVDNFLYTIILEILCLYTYIYCVILCWNLFNMTNKSICVLSCVWFFWLDKK